MSILPCKDCLVFPMCRNISYLYIAPIINRCIILSEFIYSTKPESYERSKALDDFSKLFYNAEYPYKLKDFIYDNLIRKE